MMSARISALVFEEAEERTRVVRLFENTELDSTTLTLDDAKEEFAYVM